MQLVDKTIIITGASSGIGAAAALLFSAQGANVVLGARRGSLLQECVANIKEMGGRAVSLEGDVREESYAQRLVGLAEAEFGGLDAAFNNAGMMGDISPIPNMANKNWHEVIATNLTGAFYAAKHQIQR